MRPEIVPDARPPRPDWLNEGDVLDWECLPYFVRDVEAEQATIVRKPVDLRNNPRLGGTWGSSVQRDYQSKQGLPGVGLRAAPAETRNAG